MMPRTSLASTSPIAKRLRNNTPYSSTVWVIMVATRQWASRRGSALGLPANPETAISYTPSTVLVLPTSRTRSIGSPLRRPHAAGNHNAQTLVSAHAQKAAWIKPVCNAVVAAVFIHMDLLAVRISGARLHAAHDGLKPQRRRADRAAHGPQQGAIFTIDRANQRRSNF